MRAIHVLGNRAAEKDVAENLSFFLSNGQGGFAHLGDDSKYEGLFLRIGNQLLRTLEGIEFPSGYGNELIAMENSGSSVTLHNRAFEVTYFMPQSRNCLACQVSPSQPMEIFLDVRKANDFRQWGRNYSVWEADGCIVVTFSKTSDLREDSSQGAQEYQVNIAIAHDGKLDRLENEWVKRFYTCDARRNSSCERHVFKAVTLTARNLVIAASESSDQAIREAKDTLQSITQLKRECLGQYNHQFTKSSTQQSIALDSARIALDKLSTDTGLYAGLPWFFQVWPRDELISSIALPIPDRKKTILKYLGMLMENGRLPNILDGDNGKTPSGSADGVGWLFRRCSELLDRNAFSSSEKKGLQAALKKSIDSILLNFGRNGFISNSKNETWMDTDFNDDGRAGICIEIQAFQLCMYRLLYRLSGEKTYQLLEKSLLNNVRKLFWNGTILADRLNDFTARPNLFIAAYAYPDLLTKKEWEVCICSALSGLWLDWGGLATIDKSHKNFRKSYTGEGNESYHRGDSWFWINNLAAIVMLNVNRKKFKKYIDRIISAGTTDILWKGAMGCASELSSAREQKAEGCLNQAWSDATFIELVTSLGRSSGNQVK
jgi:glycogen debranching enzyme